MCTGDHVIRIAISCDLASAFRHHGGPTYNIFHFSSRRSIFAPTSFLAGLPDARGCLYTGTEKPRHLRCPSSAVQDIRHHGKSRVNVRSRCRRSLTLCLNFVPLYSDFIVQKCEYKKKHAENNCERIGFVEDQRFITNEKRRFP